MPFVHSFPISKSYCLKSTTILILHRYFMFPENISHHLNMIFSKVS